MAASSSIAEHDTETEYTPRHSWGAVRLSTSHAQLSARLTVVDAVGEPEPRYVGRHRFEDAVTLPIGCECIHDCRPGPESCSLSGEWHVHPGEPCQVHPDAPGDHAVAS